MSKNFEKIVNSPHRAFKRAKDKLLDWEIKGENPKIKVEVGSVPHPMLPEHHISFIYVECEKGGIMVNLTDKSEAIVCTCKDDPIAVYEYCNLHGLWKAEL